jgi:hypothetical protein
VETGCGFAADERSEVDADHDFQGLDFQQVVRILLVRRQRDSIAVGERLRRRCSILLGAPTSWAYADVVIAARLGC